MEITAQTPKKNSVSAFISLAIENELIKRKAYRKPQTQQRKYVHFAVQTPVNYSVCGRIL